MKRILFIFVTMVVNSIAFGSDVQVFNPANPRKTTNRRPSVSLGQLLQLLELKTQQIDGIKARIEVRTTYKAGEMRNDQGTYGEQVLDGYIAIRRPGYVWLNTSRLSKTVLVGQSNGTRFWLAFKPGKKLFTGSADLHAPRKKENDIALNPSDIAKVLIIDEFGLLNIGTFYETLPDQYIIYAFRLSSGDTPDIGGVRSKLYSKVWIDRESVGANIAVTKHQLFDLNGRLRVEADFREYREREGINVPERVRIRWPDNTAMELHSIKVNPSELTEIEMGRRENFLHFRFNEYEKVNVDQ